VKPSSDTPQLVNAEAYQFLVNAEAYQFTDYVAPVYPPIAKAARVEGKVGLQLAMNPQTGEVLRATATSGHPLLAPNAVAAAGKWRFTPGFLTTETLNVVVDFAFRCP